MGKVKVTKEVAKVIKEKVNRYGRQMTLINHAHSFTDYGEILEDYAWTGYSAVLNEVSVETLAIALYVGYEVETGESQ